MDHDSVVDEATVAELKAIMGNDFSLLVDTFERDSRHRLDLLRSALGTGDAEAFRQAAHSFKGSAGNLGAGGVARLCQALEGMGKDGDLSQAAARLDLLVPAFERALAALRVISRH